MTGTMKFVKREYVETGLTLALTLIFKREYVDDTQQNERNQTPQQNHDDELSFRLHTLYLTHSEALNRNTIA